MKSYDYYAVTFDGAVYCVQCLPEGVTQDSEEVSPIFADSEWDYYPVCDSCGGKHDYVNLTEYGAWAEGTMELREKIRVCVRLGVSIFAARREEWPS